MLKNYMEYFMKRFVTYLYVYENGIKKRNVGFARVNCLDSVKRMDISIRNLGRYTGKAEVYTLVEGKAGVEGIMVENLTVTRGFGNASFEFSEDDIIGIRIEFAESFFVASCWREDKAEVVIGQFSVRADGEEEKTAEEKVPGEPETEISAMEFNQIPVDMKEMLSYTNYKREDTDENIHRDEVRDRDGIRDINEERGGNGVKDRNEKSERIKNKKETEDIKYKEINLEDLKKLPRKNWYLCNNSFLLYGFYCYKYLIIKSVLTEQEEKFYVGVPGVFLEPEKIVAQLFGFDEFEPDTTKTPQDKPEGRFGYWLCEIDMAL